MVKLRARSRQGATGRYRLTMPVLYDLGSGTGDAFASDAEREAAYWALRDELLATARPGERPEAFWDYEAKQLRLDLAELLAERVVEGINSPGYAERLRLERLQWLDRNGQLSTEERAAILASTSTVTRSA